jgi:hypothetical protein
VLKFSFCCSTWSSTENIWLVLLVCWLGFCGIQLVSMQKELHKQMTVMVAVPVAKEGKRMEGNAEWQFHQQFS